MVGWTAKILLGGASYAAFLWWRLGVLRGAVKRCKTVGPRWLARAMAGFSKGVASLAGVRVASLSGPGLDASVDKSKPFTYVCFCRRYRTSSLNTTSWQPVNNGVRFALHRLQVCLAPARLRELHAVDDHGWYGGARRGTITMRGVLGRIHK